MKVCRILLALSVMALLATPAFALPALQLGPGVIGDWTYDAVSETWVTDTNPFTVNAYANSDTAGANGSYAWDPAGAAAQNAFLVVSAIPMVNVDAFDITVQNDGGPLAVFDSGFGTPPVEDPNSLSPHGIFDTYFEIYEFNFDGALTTIGDTQPGGTGTGDGYVEEFAMTLNSLIDPVYGVHIDLFVVQGDGTYELGSEEDRKLVNAFAPFSHDAEGVPDDNPDVPEPASSLLLLIGSAAALLIRHRR